MSFRILNLLTDRISMIISHSKDYPKTIFNHYLNTFLYVLFQVLLIPIFLNTFESDKFAFLFFLIGMINFSSIGIGWLSSGLLKSFGEKKINVLKKVKEIMGLGLMEAKQFVEALPKAVVEDVDKEEAEKVKKELEDVGGTVELT